MVSLVAASAFAQATQPASRSSRQVGQAGKDVVWVPTPQVLVEKMLDMAKVTPQDFVMDLGSGDGRTVITAAKRGARAMGIEYNPDMVELSRKQRGGRQGERQGDVREGRSLRDRPLEGAGHHDVPAALDQHEAAPEDSRPQAGHAHRHQLVHDGGLAGRSVGNGDRRLQQLVHGAPVDRAGEGRRHVADAARAAHAEAAVPDDLRDAGIDARLPRAGCAAIRSSSPSAARSTPVVWMVRRFAARVPMANPGRQPRAEHGNTEAARRVASV